MNKFDGLTKGEIKKAEAVANKFSGRKDCKVTACSYTQPEDGDFSCYVSCEICYNYDESADFSVSVAVILLDRRRSFAAIRH